MTQFEEYEPPNTILKLIEGFQYDAKVNVPGPLGEVFIFTIGVLWDDEIRALQREIGFRIAPNDYVSLELETRFETVLRSVIAIASPVSTDPAWEVITDDEELTRFKRQELRKILNKLPRTVEYLYSEYRKLVLTRDKEFDEAIEQAKKSSREPNVPEKLILDSQQNS